MKMKRIRLSVFCMFIILFTTLSCDKMSNSGEWVAKINSDVITIDKLNTFYYAQQRSIYNEGAEEIDKRAADPGQVEKNPTLNKLEFLENLIRQRLVYNKAIEEGVMKNAEVSALIQMAKEAVIVGHFVKEKFKDDIEISDKEVGSIYSAQKARFKGVPIEQAEQYIRQNLTQQKLQIKLRELVENLKEQGKIEKNIGVLSKKESDQPEKKEELEKPK